MDDVTQAPTDVVLVSNQDSPAVAVAERVNLYLESARARNTIRGYRSSFKQFQLWCAAVGLSSLPATDETVALYISAQAGRLRPSTVEHHLAAIGKAHKAAGLFWVVQNSVLVAETLKGIKRTHGTAYKQKSPILTEDLRIMLRLMPGNLHGVRDRAILLVGFAGAFRRSELVGLDTGDLKFQAEGLLVTLRRSKTDQEGEGRLIAIPHGCHTDTCPVRALHNWLEAANIDDGPVFRPIRKGGCLLDTRLTGHAVASIVKRHANLAGLPADLFSGHSLRAGFVTSAARAGEPERRIMRQTGHNRSKWFCATFDRQTPSLIMR
jgi:integrase